MLVISKYIFMCFRLIMIIVKYTQPLHILAPTLSLKYTHTTCNVSYDPPMKIRS